MLVTLIGVFRKYAGISYNFIMRPWARSVVWVSGCSVKIEGLHHIEKGRSYIVISNHQSHMDIPILVGYIPLKMTIIAKKELFKIPIFGRGMRSFGILEIDRKNRAGAIETLRAARDILLREKISLLAFPEGTRSLDGKIHPFKKGPFVLAIDAGLPVLPVSVSGTFPILPKGRFFVRPGKVTIVIHPPIPTSNLDLDSRDELITEAVKRITEGFHGTTEEFV